MNQSGFNLVSLIAALSVLAILIAFILVELDPAEKINQSKDARRQQDILLISYALDDYMKNNNGALPDGIIPTTDKSVLCTSAATLNCDNSANIDCLVLDESGDFLSSYLEGLPIDPDKTDVMDSGYYLQVDSSNHIVVGACQVSASSDNSISYTTSLTSVPPPVWTCAGAGGFADASGHCWFRNTTANRWDCGQVCSSYNNLACESGVYTTSWNSCSIMIGTGATCSTTCSKSTLNNVNFPMVYTSIASCYYDTNAASVITCDQADPPLNYHLVCPCVEKL